MERMEITGNGGILSFKWSRKTRFRGHKFSHFSRVGLGAKFSSFRNPENLHLVSNFSISPPYLIPFCYISTKMNRKRPANDDSFGDSDDDGNTQDIPG